MTATETNSNPPLTQSEHEEWVTETLRRIDANINRAEAALDNRLDHLDGLVHEIHQALQPLRDHPDTITRGLRMLDSKHLPAWMTGAKRKD
jgi:hypothetical protein